MENKNYYEEVKKLFEKYEFVFPSDKELDDCIYGIIELSEK